MTRDRYNGITDPAQDTKRERNMNINKDDIRYNKTQADSQDNISFLLSIWTPGYPKQSKHNGDAK